MEDSQQNFLNNLFKIFYWTKHDKDDTTQILEYNSDGKKLYFKPVDSKLIFGESVGIFLPDKTNAMIMKGFEDGLRYHPEVRDIDIYEDANIDGIIIKTFQGKDNQVLLGCNGLGKYKYNNELTNGFLEEVIDFLNKGDVKFHSILREGTIDYGLSEENEQIMLENALAFFKFMNKNWDDSYYDITSPKSGEKAKFWIYPFPENAPSTNATFMVFPDEQSRQDMIYKSEHPEEFQDQDIESDYILVDIHSKEGKLEAFDKPMGKYKNLNEVERMKIVVNFLTVLKELFDYGMDLVGNDSNDN